MRWEWIQGVITVTSFLTIIVLFLVLQSEKENPDPSTSKRKPSNSTARGNFPQCGPSRASFLTGRRPESTKVYDNHHYWRRVGGNFATIPQYFKENGYKTIGLGKVFHGNRDSGKDDFFHSWTKYLDAENQNQWNSNDNSWISADTSLLNQNLPDTKLKNYAAKKLRSLSVTKQPFFMAVGFRKPHLPFLAPKEFYDYYNSTNITLPSNPWVLEDFPEISWRKCIELRNKEDVARTNSRLDFNTTTPDFKTLELRRGYYAAVSYIDSLFGQLMTTLEDVGLKNNTVVMFMGDHGYLLGEHALWCKLLSFDMAVRTPMILRTPDMDDAHRGTVSRGFVELVDVMPTLFAAAGLGEIDVCSANSTDERLCREGADVMRLVQDPDSWQRSAVFYQMFSDIGGLRHYMGFSARTADYRYTRWMNFNSTANKPLWEDVWAEELYDLVQDADENLNVANSTDYVEIRADMEEILRDGWRAQLPYG